MTPNHQPTRGTYTPTGWRIVGSGADRLAERLGTPSPDRLGPGEVDHTLYAVQCTFEPSVKGRPTVERVLDALTEQLREIDAELPRLVRDEPLEREPSRFGGLRFGQSTGKGGRAWTGEVVWRTVHPVVAGAPITTHVVLEETAAFTRLGVRVTADNGLTSVRGYTGAGQAQPPFLRALRADLTPTWLGARLSAHRIPPHGVVDFVRSTLAARNRDHPVAVLSPLQEGGYVVEPDDLAWELLGRARLYVLGEHRQTFDLSDAVGDRRMSCYWGAARCYLPGWSRHDDPFQHPLLVGERLADPILRATWLGEVGLPLGRGVELPPSILEPAGEEASPDEPEEDDEAAGEDVEAAEPEAPDEEATPAAEAVARPAVAPLPPAVPPPPDPSPLIRELLGEVRDLAEMMGGLADEVERLRTLSAVRSSSTSAIERRLGRLEEILEAVFPAGAPAHATAEGDEVEERAAAPEPADEGAPTLVQVVRDSAEAHSDTLLFLDAALDSAGDSPYEDPERVRAILEAMARVARRRRDGVLGTSLREAFADFGIDYRAGIARSTPARLREQYRFSGPGGTLVEAEEHIALGATYDPRRCLRIYFSSRVPDEPRFVIAHVGRHFEVITST